jgi:hypothetical protein
MKTQLMQRNKMNKSTIILFGCLLGASLVESACCSTDPIPERQARNRSLAADPARNIALSDIQNAPLWKTSPELRMDIPLALAEYVRQEQIDALIPDTLKRFKHGNSGDTFLVTFGNGKRCVAKTCPISEVAVSKYIPQDLRNRDLSFAGNISFGRIICATHAWIGGQLQK